ncbi:ABC transporter substrate-binding protein [Thermopolyspora sp. NPDC052614]|uniref:ABC transporter substrate-binding protein n=1 Tax=Thermopolyspora sp. NPDC052614 TaxID=3155682 RepID=UPI003417E3E9
MRRTLTALVAAAVLGLAGCASPAADNSAQQSSAARKVTVGVIPIVDVAPIYLGKQKGFFSKRGIDLELVAAQGGAAVIPGVVSGQFQFGFSNITSLVTAASKGLPVKITNAGNSSTGKDGADFGAVVVKEDSPIRTAKDLEGKTVSVNTLKNIGDTTVRASVRKAGGDPDKVRFTELAFPDMAAALTAGEVDAAWVVEPFLSGAKAQGARVVAWNFVDTAPNLPIAAYFTTSTLAKDNPELAKGFTEAMNESLAYAQAHPDEARAILTSYTKITAEQAGALTLPQWPSTIDTAALEVLVDLAVSDGIVETKPDLTTLLP